MYELNQATAIDPRTSDPAATEMAAVLHELAEATHRVGVTANTLMEARRDHQEASDRYNNLLNTAVKLREQHGL